jgi:hypothetical protein
VTGRAAGPIGEILEAEASVLERHPLVEANGAAMDRVWPLAGLLLESALDLETIDFAKPHRPVDRAAARRGRAILLSGLGVVLLLALWTIGRSDLRKLQTALAVAEGQRDELRAPAERAQRDAYTLAHLRHWESGDDVRWLDHLMALHGLIPAETVLDRWTGTLDSRGVRFDRRNRSWTAPHEITIVLDGEARDRRAADALRESLVKTESYRAASSGADAEGGKRLPHGFTYRLSVSDGAPPGATAPDSPVLDKASAERTE